MKLTIDIESTEACPENNIMDDSMVCTFGQEYRKCAGLGNLGCPFQIETCGTCVYRKHCYRTMKVDGWESVDVYVTSCSAYQKEVK